MDPVSLRRAGILALSLALLSLWVIALLSQRNWREFELSNRQATGRARVLGLNANVLGHMRDAETGQRGYLLTGQQDYLASYESAVAAVPGEIAELISRIPPGTVQYRRATQLKELADAKLADLKHAIELRKSEGLGGALEVMERGRGRLLMEDLRRLSQDIEAEEYREWSASADDVQVHANQARRLTITGVVILGFLLIAAFIANNSSARQRERLIIELAEANRSIREVRDLLRTTFYSIGDSVITMDREGTVRLMNSVAERLTGFSEAEARGRPIETIFRIASDGEPDAENPARMVLAQGTVQAPARSLTVVSKSGTETPVDVSAAPIRAQDGALQGCVLVFRDIGERKRQEEKLRETAKLESLGVLAGGIAHDFNNLLVGIIGNASLLKDELQGNAFAEQLLDGVERAGDRAAKLTRQMLAYSGRGHFVVRPLDISREVEQITALVHASIPKIVELRLSLLQDLPPVEADSAQLQQLVMNLVINAAEAVEEKRGWVEVSTSAETVQEGSRVPTVLGEALPAGEYVVLRVSDNGVGMDEATRARIFDPFFTTKFTGRGLGLAAVLGIVKGHRGGIQVESAPEQGTTFRVYLPVTQSPTERPLPDNRENVPDATRPADGLRPA